MKDRILRALAALLLLAALIGAGFVVWEWRWALVDTQT